MIQASRYWALLNIRWVVSLLGDIFLGCATQYSYAHQVLGGRRLLSERRSDSKRCHVGMQRAGTSANDHDYSLFSSNGHVCTESCRLHTGQVCVVCTWELPTAHWSGVCSVYMKAVNISDGSIYRKYRYIEHIDISFLISICRIISYQRTIDLSVCRHAHFKRQWAVGRVHMTCRDRRTLAGAATHKRSDVNYFT